MPFVCDGESEAFESVCLNLPVFPLGIDICVVESERKKYANLYSY